MRKIPTLFVRGWNGDPKYVTRQLNSECSWVAAGEGMPTVKWDGTCVMLDDAGRWWARREVKRGKADPPGFVLVERDDATGKQVGWEPVEQSGFAKWHAAALEGAHELVPGTYELIGPRINGNPQDWPYHKLIRHGHCLGYVEDLRTVPRDYDGLAAWLHARPYEGIVWHHPDGYRMAKIKKRDFPAGAAA